MRCTRYILIMLTLLLTAAPAMAVTFESSDITGTWQGYWFETTLNDSYKYWIKTTIVVDGSGDITGVWNSSTGGSGIVESGNISLANTGAVSFTMHMDDNTDVVSSSAWLDVSKTYAYAVTRHGTRMASGLLVKAGQAEYTTADFNGSWRGLSVEGEPSSVADPESYWIESLMDITADGDCTGTWDYMGEGTGVIGASSVAMNAAGVITGTLNVEAWAGGPITVTDGQMDAGKLVGAALTSKASGEEGRIIIFRRNRNDMAQADMAGTWRIYMDDIVTLSSQIWVYGEVTLDEAGSVSGTWTDPDGNTGILSGTISVGANGDLQGTVSNDTEGVVLSVEKGTLCESANCAGMVLTHADSSDPAHILTHAFLIRKQDVPAATTGNIVGANSLLLQ